MLSHNRVIEVENIEDELIAIYGLGSYPVEHRTLKFEKVSPVITIKSEIKDWIRGLIYEIR